ncbi:LTA synthase family protein [Halobacteriovorax sp. GB3]|uniref:LTA synthase family protein n=1 Tax=Halobacteriovorax sp. GB3 TaxID=2719615 RepID=UPI002362D99E|nr:LTA synthase family protein [Halobacteriovorax sp. GB3]MDD0852555.1 LTA synthase family protein [Halobacteriovorax sp. GB3]
MLNLNKTWFTTKFLWFLYFGSLAFFHIRGDIQKIVFNTENIIVICLGFFSLYFLSESFNHACKSRFMRTFWGIFLIILYYFGIKYHYRTTNSFDYAVFIDNIRDALNPESAKVVAGTFKSKDIWIAVYMIPVLIFLEIWKKIFSKSFVQRRFTFSGLFLGIYLIGLFNLPYLFEEVSYTVKTGLEYYFGGLEKGEHYKELSSKENPFSKELLSTRERKNPHIFIVALESFNGLYINKKVDGKVITPVMNELTKEGLYAKNFYGNSIQTTKGHFSILCSRLPLLRGKASYKVDPSKVDCLPKELGKIGYESLFFQIYSNLEFDNARAFMKGIGFKHVQAALPSKLTEKQRNENIWGWGIQDDLGYKQYLDSSLEIIKQSEKPLFSMVATISHHMKFNYIPQSQRYIYPGDSGNGRKERYLNSLHLSDKYLGTFIDLLKEKGLYENSLIILTGDHSFPGGEHGYYSNEMGYNEESFRIPFIAIWKNQIEPQVIDKLAFSQLDIAPTIYDYLGYNLKIRASGQSILQATESVAPIVQPYDGLYLGSINWPSKYVWSKRFNKTVVYNLLEDPMELRPVDIESKEISILKDTLTVNENTLLTK